MDAKTCIQKPRLFASVSMATVGRDGSPQMRTIGVMRVEDEKLYHGRYTLPYRIAPLSALRALSGKMPGVSHRISTCRVVGGNCIE